MSFDKDDFKKAEEEYKKKLLEANAETEDESGDAGESGTGEAGSQIQFHDFIFAGESQRDNLLPDEIRRLLAIHDNVNKENVKKQKDKRDTYKNLKEGKTSLEQYRSSQNGMNGDKPAHPILSDKAQFSGVDSQVNPVVDENAANTNDANRNELELQYRLRHQPQNAPRFNPKPTPYSR